MNQNQDKNNESYDIEEGKLSFINARPKGWQYDDKSNKQYK
jgi:hypothetical protein